MLKRVKKLVINCEIEGYSFSWLVKKWKNLTLVCTYVFIFEKSIEKFEKMKKVNNIYLKCSVFPIIWS